MRLGVFWVPLQNYIRFGHGSFIVGLHEAGQGELQAGIVEILIDFKGRLITADSGIQIGCSHEGIAHEKITIKIVFLRNFNRVAEQPYAVLPVTQLVPGAQQAGQQPPRRAQCHDGPPKG